jgi:steroid delta-isomerase-like uncharacterized protein
MTNTMRSWLVAAVALTGTMTVPACHDEPDQMIMNGEVTMTPPTTSPAPRSIQDQNRAAARRWSEELWGQGRLEVADEIVATDYVRHDGGDPFPARGPEDVKRLVAMLRGMLPDLQIEIQDMVASGDRVVTRYVGVATDTRGYMGLPASGKVTRTPAMQMFRFENGKIAESWAVRDDLGTLVQLGHLPRPGSPELVSCLAACGPR